jgi:outer membrane protein OmpA-like peptidoglycan-associated protein
MTCRQLSVPLSLAALLALGACANQPMNNAAVEAERNRLAQLQQDPNVRHYAQPALTEATQSLAAADQAAQQGDSAQLNHQIFMTDRALSTAEAQARAEAARAAMTALNQQRDQSLLQARNAQLEQAQRELQAYRTRETNQGTVVTLYDLPFEAGKATLTPGAATRLQPLVAYLQVHPERQIIIQGHTDASGSREANQALSQARADAVLAFLVNSGIPTSRVVARGMGEDFPVASNTTQAGRQQNRRVDVVIQPAASTASLPPEPGSPPPANDYH